jgi:hypothetical protein
MLQIMVLFFLDLFSIHHIVRTVFNRLLEQRVQSFEPHLSCYLQSHVGNAGYPANTCSSRKQDSLTRIPASRLSRV